MLEITKAINNNISTPQLLDLYQDILENRLGVGKLVLFSFDGEWKCILKYGVDAGFNHVAFEEQLLDIHEIQTITFHKGELSKSFEIVIPVSHKAIPLAFVLLGDVHQDKLELSAAIKHLPFIQTLTNIIIVSIENKKLYKENIQRAQLKKELELAQSMQQMLFPRDLPNTERLKVAATYLPNQQVGGDYYDFIPLNEEEYIFCMADVSGKGVAAALLMSNLQATLHSLCNYTQDLNEIVAGLNRQVLLNAKREKFVSMFIAKLDTRNQRFTYINAGHNAPMLYYESKFLLLDKGCTLLGILPDLSGAEVGLLEYTSEFTVVCYTDGLTDTANDNDDNVTLEALEQIIEKNHRSDPEFLNRALLFYAEEFKGDHDFPDDIALLTVKVCDMNF